MPSDLQHLVLLLLALAEDVELPGGLEPRDAVDPQRDPVHQRDAVLQPRVASHAQVRDRLLLRKKQKSEFSHHQHT